jgi:hypothetical protein
MTSSEKVIPIYIGTTWKQLLGLRIWMQRKSISRALFRLGLRTTVSKIPVAWAPIWTRAYIVYLFDQRVTEAISSVACIQKELYFERFFI